MFHFSMWKEVLSFTLILAMASLSVQAQEYPYKQPVKIIVPVPAGSTSDTVYRLVAEELQKSMGGIFIVENRPGQGTLLGVTQGMKSPPDGYTLIQTSAATMSLAPWTNKTLPFDPLNDFVHIGKWIEAGFLLAVRPTLKVKNLQEFIAYAKENPGKLAYGYGTVSTQLSATLFSSMAGITTLGVPYKGQPPAMIDLIGDRLQFMFVDLPAAAPYLASGQLRALGMTSATRSVFMPNLPTLAEQGFPGYEVTAWIGLAAPRGTPLAIVERLNMESRKILARPDIRSKIESIGFDVRTNSLSEHNLFVKTMLVKYEKIIKEAGIKPQ